MSRTPRPSPVVAIRTERAPALAVLAVAAGLAIACGGRSAAPPAAAAKPPRPEFVRYPEAEVAAVKDPHEYRGRPLCQSCHVASGELRGEPNAVCTGCHGLGHRNHPVAVVQKADAGDLPLLAGRAVACHTCHDPHRKDGPLRKPFDELCLSCHSRH